MGINVVLEERLLIAGAQYGHLVNKALEIRSPNLKCMRGKVNSNGGVENSPSSTRLSYRHILAPT